MTLIPVPAFSDNYLWLMISGREAVVVDPGDALPIQGYLEAHTLTLRAILVTHWHPDHIGGIQMLRGNSDIPVYGPKAEAARIPQLTHPLIGGDRIRVLNQDFQILDLPGHTLGHIAFYSAPLLFCGDTLFSAGCGRLFEGTPEQMHQSLQSLAALPGDTQVCCSHEYTLANLRFAQVVEPENPDIARHIRTVQELRAQGLPSLPSTLMWEKSINPYLRTHVESVRNSAQTQAGQALTTDLQVFTVLRRWKDQFKAPV